MWVLQRASSNNNNNGATVTISMAVGAHASTVAAAFAGSKGFATIKDWVNIPSEQTYVMQNWWDLRGTVL